MKLQLHCKVCLLPEGFEHIRMPKKAMTLREQQYDEAKGMRRVYEHH